MTRESLTARTSARLFSKMFNPVTSSLPPLRPFVLRSCLRDHGICGAFKCSILLLGAYVAVSELLTDGQSERPSVDVLFICAHTAVVAGNKRLGELARTLFV